MDTLASETTDGAIQSPTFGEAAGENEPKESTTDDRAESKDGGLLGHLVRKALQ